MQTSLSVCLIIQNEEKFLFRCLSSIKDLANEIILVDTGSTDHSILIASEFTNQIYAYKWQDSFSSARNFCLDKAKGDWILVLDGDEALDTKYRNLLRQKIQVQDIEAYFLSIDQSDTETMELLKTSDLQLRLFRNNKKYRYRGIIYEQITDSIINTDSSGRIELADEIRISHYGYTQKENKNRYRLNRNIELLNHTMDGEEHEPLRHFYLGREYYHHHQFEKALENFLFVYQEASPQEAYYPELLRFISVCLYMLNKIPEALDFVDHSLTLLNNMGDLYYIKAIVHKEKSQYGQAYQAYKECLEVPSQPLHYSSVYCQHKYKIFYCLGSLSEYFMDKDKALFYYYQSLLQNPHWLDSLRRMISILDPRKNPDYTIQSLNKVFDLSDTAIQAEIAIYFYKEGAYPLALDLIQCMEQGGIISEQTSLLKGLCLLRMKQFAEAEKILQSFLASNTLYIKANQYLLLSFWLRNDHHQAARCLEKISNAGTDPATLYVFKLLTLADVSQSNVNAGEVYPLLQELMELLVELGDFHRINEAFQNLSPLLGDRPSHLLAKAYYKAGKYALAQEEFASLLALNSTDAYATYYLGKSCWAQGNFETAVDSLCETIKKGLNTPKIRWETARLFQELAIKNLKKAMKNYPDCEDQKRLIHDLEASLLEL